MRGDDLLRDQLVLLLPTGREHAVSSGELAFQLGVSTREVGALVADLIVLEGYCIGSICGHGAGYFLIRPDDDEDLRVGVGHTVQRAVASFDRVRALRRNYYAMGSAQTTLFADFEKTSL